MGISERRGRSVIECNRSGLLARPINTCAAAACAFSLSLSLSLSLCLSFFLAPISFALLIQVSSCLCLRFTALQAAIAIPKIRVVELYVGQVK